MRTGRLRHKVTVQRQATTKDAAGQLSDTWTTLCERTVSIEPLNGREYFNASGENSQVTTRIRMRYDGTTKGIKTYDRIVDYASSPGTVYDILSVINVQQRNRELVLMVKTG